MMQLFLTTMVAMPLWLIATELRDIRKKIK